MERDGLMLALGIALIAIALLCPTPVPTFVIWLLGIGALGFWMGRRVAVLDERKEVKK